MELPDLVELKFDGGGMSPNDIRLSELARILRTFEDYLVKQLSASHDASREEVHVSLNSIRHSSASYGVSSSMKDATLEAVSRFGRAVKANNYGGLVPASRDLARQLVGFTRRHHCLAHLITKNGDDHYAVTVTPDTQVGGSRIVRGETQYYGVLERIGGAEPKFVLRISEGTPLHGDISQTLAVELANRLYSWVGIRGLAEWDPTTGDVVSFRADGIIPYKGPGIAKAMELLRKAVGEYWDEEESELLEIASRIRGGGFP